MSLAVSAFCCVKCAIAAAAPSLVSGAECELHLSLWCIASPSEQQARRLAQSAAVALQYLLYSEHVWSTEIKFVAAETQCFSPKGSLLNDT